MLNQSEQPQNYMDDPRPDGREPIPVDRLPLMEAVFDQIPEVQMVLVFTVSAEGVMQSEATFGIWMDDAIARADQIETMRRLGEVFHTLVDPNYYLDLLLLSPQDAALWSLALTYGDVIYARDETVIAQAQETVLPLDQLEEPIQAIEVLRVL